MWKGSAMCMGGQCRRGTGHRVCWGVPWGWHRGGSVYLPHRQGRGRGGSGFPGCGQCRVPAPCAGSARAACARAASAVSALPERAGLCAVWLWAGSAHGAACAGTAPAAVRRRYLQRRLHEHGGRSAREMLPWPCFQMRAPAACSGQRGSRQCAGSYLVQCAQAACRQAVHCPSAQWDVCRQRAGRVCSNARAACGQRARGSALQCAQCSVCRQHPCCVHGAGSKLAVPWQCSVQHGQAVGQRTGRAVCAGSLGQCTGSVGTAGCQRMGQCPGSMLRAACRQCEGSAQAA